MKQNSNSDFEDIQKILVWVASSCPQPKSVKSANLVRKRKLSVKKINKKKYEHNI